MSKFKPQQFASASFVVFGVTLFTWALAALWTPNSIAMESREEATTVELVCVPVQFNYGSFCPTIEGFDAMVRDASAMYGVDADLIVAQVLLESSCRETVIGDDGAAYGLTQIHPRWWRGKLSKEGIIEKDEDLLDARMNLTAMAFITTVNSRNGKRPLFNTLARYNGGPLGMTKPAARRYAEKVLLRMGAVREARESFEGVCP